MAGTSGWIEGAAIGFVSAFAIQAFAGHWKLWVDQRKALVDDLVKALDSARAAGMKYFEQETIESGHHHELAREAIYANKVVADLFGIIDRQFGPVSASSQATFRQYRELATGEGFLQAGKQDRQRAADIAIVAASCSSSLREWHCSQLSALSSTATFFQRVWRNRRLVRFQPHAEAMAKRTR